MHIAVTYGYVEVPTKNSTYVRNFIKNDLSYTFL